MCAYNLELVEKNAISLSAEFFKELRLLATAQIQGAFYLFQRDRQPGIASSSQLHTLLYVVQNRLETFNVLFFIKIK